MSPLHIAVQQKNHQLIEILLELEDIDCSDTALHAIRENESEIAMMILDKKRSKAVISEYEPAIGSSEFPDEMTPLDVAAQCGHYEIIKLLSERGHKISKPHKPSCNCKEVCKPRRAIEDPLTIDKFRLSRYKAVSNGAYICYNSPDPFLEAFILYVELEEAASYEREFYKAYKSLAENVALFATNLIACTRKAEEIELILSQKSGINRQTNFKFPRLLLAMECKQKTFVAHPHVQQVIEHNWIGDWYEWKDKSVLKKVLLVITRIPILPIIVIMLIFVPNISKSKRWKIPVNRFLSGISSYLIFLIFLLIETTIDKCDQQRGPPASGFEPVIVVYVISYIWAAIRLSMVHGRRRYFRSLWNWYEVVMLFIFVLTFLFWVISAIDVQHRGQRDLDRKYWHRYDPTLIAEGLFCIATIMAFFKLLFVFQLDYHLGPLQMSLGKMIKDVTKFLFLFMIVLLAFSAGLANLYQYYDGMVQVDDETKIKTQQAASFVGFGSSLKTLFWAIFCMSPIESADVVIENLAGEKENETIINKHTFTEMIGYLAFACFEFISVVVVLNMLIACMSNTFTQFTDNVAVEWTFGRTEVYIDVMAHNALPPPFNLLPTGNEIQRVGEFIKLLIKPSPEKKARWNFKRCCYIDHVVKDDRQKFRLLMGVLIMRYFRTREVEVEESNTEGLRRDLQQLRDIVKEAMEIPA
ncbi:short transient receptor potential channel 4-like [Venturia canescens]|uniref:short transient receptor potential channel 4-like n=1 Tax=Venturia canescens TaxID=32260 RepID=UPI001C9BC909|nr:short transient receptor potential channel 4-like [Venturia canescens]